MFLAKYKLMLASDCKMIYKSKDYHRKRLKVLEKNRYIRRINKTYIKLDDKGTKLVREFGYDYSFNCRKKEYINRLKEIARIASLSINSNIKFITSWNLKENNIYTEISRKFLGELSIMNKNRIVYYISKKNQLSYIKQVRNDIQKLMNYNNVIIFIDNNETLEKINNFVFGKESVLFIEENNNNLNILKQLEAIDVLELVDSIYSKEEILLSNWKLANYMTTNEKYIIFMPFIDNEKIYALDFFLRNNPYINKKIDIVTLKCNRDYIEKKLLNRIDLVLLDTWLGGLNDKK